MEEVRKEDPNGDAYVDVESKVFNIPVPQVDDKMRQAVKTMAF